MTETIEIVPEHEDPHFSAHNNSTASPTPSISNAPPPAARSALALKIPDQKSSLPPVSNPSVELNNATAVASAYVSASPENHGAKAGLRQRLQQAVAGQ
jgi:hypothetical protein